MDRNEVEALLTRKYEAGEAETGLYNTGLQFVVMDVVDGEVTFQWFQDAHSLEDLLDDTRSEVELLDVLKNAKPLIIQLPVDASTETKAALSKIVAADNKR